MIAYALGRIPENGDEASSIQWLWDLGCRKAREFHEGGEEVDAFRQLPG